MVVLAFSTVAFRVISITRKDNAVAKTKSVHFAPTIVTVHTIWQSKQEVRDKRASYARVLIQKHFSERQRIVPADAPFVPSRDEQGGPELFEEPAAEIIPSREAFRVISITRKDNAVAKTKSVHFAPTIVTVHTIWQSKQEVQDKRASYARVLIQKHFSECQRIVPADAPFVPSRDEELVEEPAAEIILPTGEIQADELIHDQDGVQTEDKPSAGSLVQGLEFFVDNEGKQRRRSTRNKSQSDCSESGHAATSIGQGCLELVDCSLVQGLEEFIDDKGRKRRRSTRKRSKV